MTHIEHPKRLWTIIGAGCVVVAALFCLLLLPAQQFTWLMREDHPIELVGALSLLAASVLSFLTWRRATGWSTVARLSLLGLALLFFFGFGEEMSWGQRIFGIETPEALTKANRQEETNLHNLDFFSGALNSDNLFRLFWIVMGILIPLVSVWDRARRMLERVIVVFPPPFLVGFVFTQALATGAGRVLDSNPDLYKSEVFAYTYSVFELKESGICLFLALGMYWTYRKVSDARRGPAASRDAAARAGDAPVAA